MHNSKFLFALKTIIFSLAPLFYIIFTQTQMTSRTIIMTPTTTTNTTTTSATIGNNRIREFNIEKQLENCYKCLRDQQDKLRLVLYRYMQFNHLLSGILSFSGKSCFCFSFTFFSNFSNLSLISL